MLTVYSKNNCQACDSAKVLLDSKSIPYEIRNCDEDFEAFNFIVEHGHRSFPQIYEGNALFATGGYKGLVEKLNMT